VRLRSDGSCFVRREAVRWGRALTGSFDVPWDRVAVSPFYLLPPWAMMVCYSRTILRVHSAADVTCGALLGVVVGVTTFVVVRGVGWAMPTEKLHAVGDNKP